MTVRISGGKFRLAFWVPTCCLGIAVKSAVKSELKRAEKKGNELEPINKKEIREIVKNLREAKKFHGKLEIVTVEAADGTRVKITL